MDCEACIDRLVDLLYEQLDEPDAAVARAHLEACESCAGALARLEKGRELASFMVMEEPPVAVRNAVLAAARERAAMRAPVKVPDAVERPMHAEAREARRADAEEEGGLWSSFLRWLGGFAMGPQVAMAMMLLLMVGIGLWYLPGLRSHDPADPHAILNPAPGDEVGPSQGLEPAEPLDLEADPRTGRIRPREDEPHRAPPRHAQRVEPPPEAVVAEPDELADLEALEEAADEAPAPEQQEERRPTRERHAELRAEALEAPEAAMEMDIAPGQSALAEGGQRSSVAQQGQMQAPAYATRTPASAEMEPTPGVAPMPASPPSQAPRSQAAMARAQGADDELARPTTDSRHALAQAAHRQASSLRSSGNCRGAIPVYQRLLAQNPTYALAHEARLDLADCYRATGSLTQARRLLEQSARDPRVASRAQRELVRLEAAERAMDRAPETERTPDRPAQRSYSDEAAAEANE